MRVPERIEVRPPPTAGDQGAGAHRRSRYATAASSRSLCVPPAPILGVEAVDQGMEVGGGPRPEPSRARCADRAAPTRYGSRNDSSDVMM